MSGNAKRAAALKAKYPDIRGIPDRITRKVEQKLIAEHIAKSQQSTGTSTMRSVKSTKARDRALSLKKTHPDMKGIPAEISKKKRKNMITAYKASKGIVQEVAAKKRGDRQTQLPQRPRSAPKPSPIPHKQGTYPTRQYAAVHGTDHVIPGFGSQGRSTRSKPNKMAPLSDERRAEVARNLSGNSNDDPITLD